MDVIKLNQLLATVYQRLVFGNTTKYSWQVKFPDKKDPDYLPPWCSTCRRSVRCEHMPWLNMEHLRRHFEQIPWKPFQNRPQIYSGISIAGLFPGNRVKWLVIDMDSPLACQVVNDMLLPVLDKHEVDYFWEHSGTKTYEKAHLMILFDCMLPAMRSLIKMLLEEAKMSDWQEWKRQNPDTFKIEFFPYQHEDNMIRMPGSLHLRTGRVNPITYKGIKSSNADFVLQVLATMKVMDQDKVANLILKLNPKYNEMVAKEKQEKQLVDKATKRSTGKFVYVPQNLPLPNVPVHYPRTTRKILGNCQAYHRLWNMTVNEGFLGHSGRDDTHKWGLILDSMALFDKLKLPGEGRQANTLADTFIEWSNDTFRPQGAEGHNWDSYKDKFKDNPDNLITPCKKMESEFDMCRGCPYKTDPALYSPVQFVTGEAIVRSIGDKLDAVSNEYIRQNEFPIFKQDMLDHMVKSIRFKVPGARPKDLVLAYHQGAGKTQTADELFATFSKAGVSSLIAVPDTALALQHKRTIEQMGQKVFCCFSFDKLFTDEVKDELNIKHDCPHEMAIKHDLRVFPDSGRVKKKYCKSCPFASDCPYPQQYKNATESRANVVVMQHAHLEAKPALHKLFERDFAAMLIDETFIDSCFYSYQATEEDLIILDFLAKRYQSLAGVYKWLTAGGYPVQKFELVESDLEDALKVFEHVKHPYILPDLIRGYMDNLYYDLAQGVDKFTPLPQHNLKLRLFTDATSSVEYMQVLLNNAAVEVRGEEYMLNPRYYHPLNEYYQALDGSTSVRQMNEPGYLEFLLDHACREFEKQGPDKLGLVTTYKNQVKKAEDFIAKEYSHIYDRLKVSHMQIGTNEHSHRHFQFLLACRYPNALDLAKEAWKMHLMWNHWVGHEGHCLGNSEKVIMAHHTRTSAGASYPTEKVTLRRRELIDKDAYEVEYRNIMTSQPSQPLFQIAAKRFKAIKQQSNRMRYANGKLTVLWDYDKTETDLLVTKSFRINQLRG